MNIPFDLRLLYLPNGNIRASWDYLHTGPSGQYPLFAVDIYIDGILNQNLSQLYHSGTYLDILLPHISGSYSFTVRSNDGADLGPISSLSSSLMSPQSVQNDLPPKSTSRIWILLLWTLFVVLLLYLCFITISVVSEYAKERKSFGQLYSWKLNPSLNKFFAF
jgi:hypothetical protein